MTNAPTRAETTAFFAVPVTSLEQAHAFLRSLFDAGLLFHPEDAPSDIVDGFGIPLFSDEESTLLEQRIAEIYTFDADPCGFCLTLQGWSDE
jgi:hypothetical protein